MGIRDHTVSLFKPKPDEMKCHTAKIKGKTYLSQFKRKGDVSCYVMLRTSHGFPANAGKKPKTTVTTADAL